MQGVLVLLIAIQERGVAEELAKASGVSGDRIAAARETIGPAEVRSHVALLASDELEGRNAGTDGAKKAAYYLARQFREIGLRPLANHGHFQRLRFPLRDIGGKRYIQPRYEETFNVLGILEGRARKEEVVIVGAHYDHVGRTGQWNPGRRHGKEGDQIWNGADDNASGTAALLELARALARLRPARSILFIAFGAEEHGLAGSRWYCDSPPVPLKRTVLMVNLDMIGRRGKRPIEVHGGGSGKGLRRVVLGALRAQGQPAIVFRHADIRMATSDHYPFFEAGVPSLFFFTGYHEDYHRSTDHADRLDYEGIASIARVAFDVVWTAANRDGRFPFCAPRRLGVLTGVVGLHKPAKVKLKEGQGGIEVLEVRPGTPAERAKVLVGDVIVGVGRWRIPAGDSLRYFRRMIDVAPAGKPVPLLVLREGKEVRLAVEWGR